MCYYWVSERAFSNIMATGHQTRASHNVPLWENEPSTDKWRHKLQGYLIVDFMLICLLVSDITASERCVVGNSKHHFQDVANAYQPSIIYPVFLQVKSANSRSWKTRETTVHVKVNGWMRKMYICMWKNWIFDHSIYLGWLAVKLLAWPLKELWFKEEPLSYLITTIKQRTKASVQVSTL